MLSKESISKKKRHGVEYHEKSISSILAILSKDSISKIFLESILTYIFKILLRTIISCILKIQVFQWFGVCLFKEYLAQHCLLKVSFNKWVSTQNKSGVNERKLRNSSESITSSWKFDNWFDHLMWNIRVNLLHIIHYLTENQCNSVSAEERWSHRSHCELPRFRVFIFESKSSSFEGVSLLVSRVRIRVSSLTVKRFESKTLSLMRVSSQVFESRNPEFRVRVSRMRLREIWILEVKSLPTRVLN